jgi:hypothetical protein
LYKIAPVDGWLVKFAGEEGALTVIECEEQIKGLIDQSKQMALYNMSHVPFENDHGSTQLSPILIFFARLLA